MPEHVEHVEKLRSLKHVNLAPVLKVMRHDSMERPSCNLKEYALDRRCNLEDMVMFLSQVASAFHYLHANHILHGDLRAEHVNVIAPNKVLATSHKLAVLAIFFFLKRGAQTHQIELMMTNESTLCG